MDVLGGLLPTNTEEGSWEMCALNWEQLPPGFGPFSLTDQTTFSLGTTLAHIRNGAK